MFNTVIIIQKMYRLSISYPVIIKITIYFNIIPIIN